MNISPLGATRIGVWTIKHLLSPIQRWIYRVTGGRFLSTIGPGRSVLLLTTIGRRTGKDRTTPVFYLRAGESIVICNVNPGFEHTNPWVVNLRANPLARLQIGRKSGYYHAREATEAEVERFWPKLVALWPAYQHHYQRSGRRVIFILTHVERRENNPENQFITALKRPATLLIFWAIMLFAIFIFSVFLHEVGHGLGAKIDGIHVSTGFNKIGDFGKSPGDPDFRSNGIDGAFWISLLGPVTTWVLAIVFTIWLYRFKEPSRGALTIGALAVANGLIRALPMLLFILSALPGKPYLEDEVGWGVWYVLKFLRPDMASPTQDYHAILATYPSAFLVSRSFWIPPLLSLAVSLACLIPAYRRIYKLWGDRFNHWGGRLIFGLLPIAAWIATVPVLNWLDRLIRINW